MKISAAESRRAIKLIHQAIEVARDRFVDGPFVFIGGGLVPILLTDPAAAPARPTKDVDVVHEIASMGESSYIRQLLLSAGFTDTIAPDKPGCALFFGEWRVDFLTTSPDGASGNRWFSSVVEDPVEEVVDGVAIWRASTPSWIATKLEAWGNRGRLLSGAPDYYHQDLEDVIAVLDGRPEAGNEITEGLESVRNFIMSTFSILMASREFQSALPGHTGGEERAEIVLGRMRQVLQGDEFFKRRDQ